MRRATLDLGAQISKRSCHLLNFELRSLTRAELLNSVGQITDLASKAFEGAAASGRSE